MAHGSGLLDSLGSGPVTLSAPLVVAIGGDASDKAAAEKEDPLMNLPDCTLHEDAQTVFCRRGHGKRMAPRCPDDRRDGDILTLIGKGVALTTRGGIGRKVPS